jgi:type II secretory pathway component PulK
MNGGRMIVRSHRDVRPRRGMALVLALTLVALAAAAAVVVGRSVMRDFQSTQRAGDEAQLRQMLLAGATDAVARVNAGNDLTRPQTIALPKELTDRGGSLRVMSASTKTDESLLTVHAELAGHLREQQLRFTRTNGRWHVATASLAR